MCFIYSKNLIRKYLIFIVCFVPFLSWSQFKVTGVVISKSDNELIPGATVVEKGTKNGTTTDLNGEFSIEVSGPNATLIFSFVGMVTKEYSIKGKDNIKVETKWDCNKDFFDSNRIRIYAQSGLINNPIGGQIDIASPYFMGGVLEGSYSYQTNTKENIFQEGSLELKHSISNCDFDVDFRITYRNFSFDNQFDSSSYSFETDFNLSRVSFIAGYGGLDLNRIDPSSAYNSSGLIVGIGTSFGRPLYPDLFFKMGIYKEHIEYQAKFQGNYKRFLIFLKYYKLSSFNELSLGIGYNLNY